MWDAVQIGADGRGHKYGSFDEFGLLEARHGGVAPLELGSRQDIPLLERRRVGHRFPG
jgi:hypothetical protein